MKRIPRSIYILLCAVALVLACNIKKSETRTDATTLVLEEKIPGTR